LTGPAALEEHDLRPFKDRKLRFLKDRRLRRLEGFYEKRSLPQAKRPSSEAVLKAESRSSSEAVVFSGETWMT
jgi:hypothetical protein